MTGPDDTFAEAGSPSPEGMVTIVEIRRLHNEVALLREHLSRAEEAGRSTVSRGAAEQVKKVKSQVEAVVAQAQGKADLVERQIRTTVKDRPVTIITASVALGYLLALVTWPYARRER